MTTVERATAPLLAFTLATLPLIGLATLQVTLPILAPVLMAAIGRPPAAYGWVAGAVGLGSVILYISNSAFTPVLGPVRALLAGTAVAVLGAALVIVGSLPLMLLGGLLIGFGYGTTTPAGSQIMADHTPREWRGTLFSMRQAGVPLGGVIAGLSCAALVAHLGWRSAVAAMGGLCAALALPLLRAPRAFNDSRPRAQFLLSRFLSPANVIAPFRIVRSIPGLARMAAACIGFAVVQGAVNAFAVSYLHAGLGLSLELAGMLFAVQQGASVAGRVVLGPLADWIGSPRPVLIALACGSATAAALMGSLIATWPVITLIAASFFIGFMVSTWNGLYLAEVANLAPPERVSEATAATTFFVFTTYMATPPLAGLSIARFGFRPTFLGVAAAALVGGIVLASARRRPA